MSKSQSQNHIKKIYYPVYSLLHHGKLQEYYTSKHNGRFTLCLLFICFNPNKLLIRLLFSQCKFINYSHLRSFQQQVKRIRCLNLPKNKGRRFEKPSIFSIPMDQVGDRRVPILSYICHHCYENTGVWSFFSLFPL